MADETALKDGNRIPTLLFDQGGETRRVSSINPLPVSDVGDVALIKTATKEVRSSDGVQTIVTPTPGKKLVVRGCSIIHEPATGGVATLQFQGGTILFRTYRSDVSGHFIPMNVPGNIDEPIVGEIPSGTGGNRAFFLVNYVEE